MKLKEKNIAEHFDGFVLEHFDSKSMSGPSRDFLETVRGIKDLNFIGSSMKDFANLCKLNIPKKR